LGGPSLIAAALAHGGGWPTDHHESGLHAGCRTGRKIDFDFDVVSVDSQYSSAEYFKGHQEPPCMGWRPRAGPAGPRASNGTDAACNNRLKEPGLQRQCVTGAECQELNESEPGLSKYSAALEPGGLGGPDFDGRARAL